MTSRTPATPWSPEHGGRLATGARAEAISRSLTDATLAHHLQICVADNRGRIVFANENFCQVSGYDYQELIGHPLRMLRSGRHPDKFYKELWSTIRAGQCWRGEISNLRKDGSVYWVELTVVPLEDPAGEFGEGPHFVGIGSEITRLVEAEQHLRQSEAKFRSLTETVSAAIILHRGSNILYANKALERITGYSREELLTMPMESLAHPDFRPTLNKLIQDRLAGSRADLPTSYEMPVLTKQQEIRWAEITAGITLLDGQPTAIGTAIDITERKRAEARLKHTQRVLSQIIDGDPVPTFVIDNDHRITHWNRACAIITGMPAEEAIGTREAWRAFYPEKRPVLADLIVDGAEEAAIETFYQSSYHHSSVVPDAFEAESYFPQFGEGGRWVTFTAAPLRDAQGRIVGAIETLQDVTERKTAEAALLVAQVELEDLVERRTAQLVKAKAELEADMEQRKASEAELLRRNQELTELNQRLADAQDQLLQSEKMASIGQLAAGVAHEINNPIGYVQSNLGTLETYLTDLFDLLGSFGAAMGALPGDHPLLVAARHLEKDKDLEFLRQDIPTLLAESREGITRVRKIVADLKDFSRVDSTQDWQWANLHQGLDSTLNIVNNEIKYKADVIKDYGQMPDIECRPSQLNQVFMNLLVNAAHAIQRERGHITLRTGTEGDFVWVEIQDDGAGIAPEHLNRIFDPFFTTKPVGKGTGLGLSLSFGIIQKHHGQINVASSVGEGTTFRVRLPIRQPDQEGQGESPAKALPPAGESAP